MDFRRLLFVIAATAALMCGVGSAPAGTGGELFRFITPAVSETPLAPGKASAKTSQGSVLAESPWSAETLDVEGIEVDYREVAKRYEYDRTDPLNIEIKGETAIVPAGRKIHFYYDSPGGERIPAVLMMPVDRVEPMKPDRSTSEGAYPAVFFMHFHVSDKSLADLFSGWTGRGIAVMAIDGVFRGERDVKGKDILMPDPVLSAEYMQMQVLDILRGFDVLAQWDGIDPGRIGYMGISMGSLTGSVAVTIDERIKSIILADGAADFSLMFEHSDYGSLQRIKRYMEENNIRPEAFVEAFKYVEPAVFTPHIGDRPVLMMNGREDTTLSMPAMKKLYNVLGTKKKKILWYESGHILPFDRVVVDSLKWFKMTL